MRSRSDTIVVIQTMHYTINNPMKISFLTGKPVISIGIRCTSAIACRYAGIRKVAMPFDWTIPTTPSIVQAILEEDFKDFIPDVANEKFINRYGIRLAHFNPDRNAGIEAMKRRISRCRQLLNTYSGRIYFVYTHEDYLYDPAHRATTYTTERYNEMIQLYNYMCDTFPRLDIVIIYIDFADHPRIPSANIVHVKMHVDRTCDNPLKPDPTLFVPFRKMCGDILCKLFGTSPHGSIHSTDFDWSDHH